MALYQLGREVNGLRRTDEWVGLLVVAAVLLFLGAVLEAGLLRDWFRPVSRLRIVLPQSGVGGLSPGAELEVLGIHAGSVRRIVLSPNQQIYAEADIDEQAKAFIRRDSAALIRRRFGLVGDAYVDISRGSGESLNWSYAVVEATTERAPTDTVNGMIDELRQKILPVLDDAKRAMDSAAAIAENLQEGRGTLGRLLTDETLADQTEQTIKAAKERLVTAEPMVAQVSEAARRASALMQEISPVLDDAKRTMDSVVTISDNLREGHGTVGRLLADDTLVRDTEQTVEAAQTQLAALAPLIDKLDEAAKQADALMQFAASGKEGAPNLMLRADAVLQNLQTAARDISRATPYFPGIARNVGASAATMPALLTQTQIAAAELELLLKQMRGFWLFGGFGSQQSTPIRTPPQPASTRFLPKRN